MENKSVFSFSSLFLGIVFAIAIVFCFKTNLVCRNGCINNGSGRGFYSSQSNCVEQDVQRRNRRNNRDMRREANRKAFTDSCNGNVPQDVKDFWAQRDNQRALNRNR